MPLATGTRLGPYEIYVPVPERRGWGLAGSRDGGEQPLWARNGRELFYESPDGRLMSVPVQIGDDFTYGNPETVIATPYLYRYDISPTASASSESRKSKLPRRSSSSC